MGYHCLRMFSRNFGRLSDPKDDWPISRAAQKLHLHAIFRLPMLLCTVAIYMGVPGINHKIVAIGAVLIFVAIWIELIQTFLSRFVFGHRDIHFRRLSVALSQSCSKWQDNKLKLIRDFMLFLIGFMFVSIFGYAGIFSAVQCLCPGSFTGSAEPRSFFDFLYFSSITFTTVGYGDILPVGRLARLLVMSELSVSVATLILLIFVYSITSGNEPNSNQ
jgi:hypothetical protein